ncbi:hypothetical protein PCAR4_830021 [Paraburkholderia caribensis]|nr:hypothetical protein PCAR4_830021 [Paraburkholderia caribensis]
MSYKCVFPPNIGSAVPDCLYLLRAQTDMGFSARNVVVCRYATQAVVALSLSTVFPS